MYKRLDIQIARFPSRVLAMFRAALSDWLGLKLTTGLAAFNYIKVLVMVMHEVLPFTEAGGEKWQSKDYLPLVRRIGRSRKNGETRELCLSVSDAWSVRYFSMRGYAK